MSFGTIIPRISVSIQCKQNVQQKRRRYLNSSVCFVTKFGLSSGMKYPIFGNVIPVTLFATFGIEVAVKLPKPVSQHIVKIGISSFCLAVYSLFCSASSNIAL